MSCRSRQRLERASGRAGRAAASRARFFPAVCCSRPAVPRPEIPKSRKLVNVTDSTIEHKHSNKPASPALILVGVLAGLALLAAAAPAQAADWEGRYHKGDLGVEIGLGFGSHGDGFGYGIAATPAVEWIPAVWKVGAAAPLAVGLAAKGLIEYVPAAGLGFGADALALMHLGFDGLDVSEFLQNLDVYTGFGAGLVYLGEADVPFGLVFPAIYSGFSWYLKEKLAIYLEGVYRHGWRAVGYGGGVIGVRLKRTPGN